MKMHDFWFYANRTESRRLLGSLLEKSKIRFAIDEGYPTPDCQLYSETGKLVDQRRVFLFSPLFSQHPPAFRLQQRGEMAGRFFIDEARGGPCFVLTMGAEFEEKGRSWLSRSVLARRTSYWSDESGGPIAASDALISIFDDIVQNMRSEMASECIDNEVCWFASETISRFRNNEIGLRVGDYCYASEGRIEFPAAWTT